MNRNGECSFKIDGLAPNGKARRHDLNKEVNKFFFSWDLSRKQL